MPLSNDEKSSTLLMVATVLLAARIASLRGQPLINDDIDNAINDAERMLAQVNKRCSPSA